MGYPSPGHVVPLEPMAAVPLGNALVAAAVPPTTRLHLQWAAAITRSGPVRRGSHRSLHSQPMPIYASSSSTSTRRHHPPAAARLLSADSPVRPPAPPAAPAAARRGLRQCAAEALITTRRRRTLTLAGGLRPAPLVSRPLWGVSSPAAWYTCCRRASHHTLHGSAESTAYPTQAAPPTTDMSWSYTTNNKENNSITGKFFLL